MNKAELIEAITDRVGDKRTATSAVEAVVDTIMRAVTKGEKVAITGFGVFEKQNRPARTVRNPATGATIKKKKTSVPKFRPGAGFKAFVAGDKKLPAVPKATPTKATAKKTAAASTSGTTTRGAAKKAAGTGRKTAASKTTASKSSGSKTAASKTAAKRAPAAKKTSARGAAKTTSPRGGAKKTAAKRSR